MAASYPKTIAEVQECTDADLVILLSTLDIDAENMSKSQMQQLLIRRLGIPVAIPAMPLLSPVTTVDVDVTNRTPPVLSPVRDKNSPGAQSRASSGHSPVNGHAANEFTLKCREVDLEIKRIEGEFEIKRLQLEYEKEKERSRQHELTLKQMELQNSAVYSSPLVRPNGVSAPTSVPVPAFRVDTATKRLPRFNENAVEEFFMAVDRTAVLNSWPTEKLTAIIQPLLVGKALKTFLALDTADSQDYNKVRAAILKAYAVVPEQARVLFRTVGKQPHETYSEFAFRLSTHFKRWVEGNSAYDNLEKLRELFKLEQFQQTVDSDLRIWLLEQKPTTLEQAAKLADQYVTLRRNVRVTPYRFSAAKRENSRPVHTSSVSDNKPNQVGYQSNVKRDDKSDVENKQVKERNSGPPRVRCFYCHGFGHVISQCTKRKENRSNNAQTTSSDVMKADVDYKRTNVDVGIDPLYVPYCCTGAITKLDGTTKSITLLRDTGALQSLLNRSMLTDDDYVDTGERRFVRGVSGEVVPVPLVETTLQSKFCNGSVLCGIADGLPHGIFALIGNDLCQADANVCITTRSQAAALNALNSDQPLKNAVDADANYNANSTPVESTTVDDSMIEDDDLSLLFNSAVSLPLSAVTGRAELIKLQQEDPILKPLFDLVANPPEPELQNNKAHYALSNGVLVRYWRDLNVPHTANCVTKQIVVPSCLRTSLLQLGHDIPAAGHLGQKKTRARILQHYYWPQVERAIRDYCRTCDRCQRLGKGPNPPKAPLQNLPLVSEPFKRLIIDIVGPLPECTDTGNRFILTVLDACTHYPEAIPLKRHTAKDVANALVSVWSRFGLCEEIQSDQGSDFMSELMQVFLTEFHISQIKSSIVHPQSQGAVERFHATLKNMLRALSDRYPQNWDSALPWVLFAYREVPVETLGLSPFELLFARSVKGPLAIVKHAWLSDDELEAAKPNVVEFVLDTRNRLRDAIEMANEHAAVERKKSKTWYDRNARLRTFEVGEKVLVMLPMQGKALNAKYCGPYEIVEQLGAVDYVVSTPDRRKTRRVCHVNLLKPYRERDVNLFPPPNVLDVSHVSVVDTENQEENCSEKQNDLLRHLNDNQKSSMQSLLFEFGDIFSDVPGKTTMIEHTITLQANAKPFCGMPYRLSPDKAEFVKQELADLKKQGIITDAPPDSAWAAPIVVVPKADGGWRMCTDFRRLNELSVPDPYPLPRIDDLLDKLGKAKYLTKVDMSKGYYQLPVARDAIPLTGFVTPFGHFCWRYMPFGLRNAPATFSRLVSKLLVGCDSFCVGYLDDLLIFSETWEDHLKHIRIIFRKIREANLTLKLSKCEFAAAELDYLGHHVGLGKLQPREQKVQALLQFPRPTNRKSLQRYLGLAGYFRRFIPHFSYISSVLSDLLKKNAKFVWTDKCENAFIDLKSRLATRPILRPPNYDLPFCIAVDTSGVAIGAYLFQIVDDIEHPVCYLSKKLNKHQMHYSTVEKEAYGLMLATRAFSVYFGCSLVTVYTDHSPLQFLSKMSNHNQKLLRWNLELQQYNLMIVHRAGRDNVLPDLLSRPSL